MKRQLVGVEQACSISRPGVQVDGLRATDWLILAVESRYQRVANLEDKSCAGLGRNAAVKTACILKKRAPPRANDIANAFGRKISANILLFLAMDLHPLQKCVIRLRVRPISICCAAERIEGMGCVHILVGSGRVRNVSQIDKQLQTAEIVPVMVKVLHDA